MPCDYIHYEGSPGRGARGAILKLTLFALALSLLPAVALSQEAMPRIEASYVWAESFRKGDGTYGVRFDMNFHNPGWTDLQSLTVDLLGARGLKILPHQNRLDVGTLGAGQNAQLSWTVTALFAPPGKVTDEVDLVLSGQAIDGSGNAISVLIEDGEKDQ